MDTHWFRISPRPKPGMTREEWYKASHYARLTSRLIESDKKSMEEIKAAMNQHILSSLLYGAEA